MDSVFPLVGVVTSTLISLSPYDTIQSITSNPSLVSEHNSVPYALIFTNSLAWLLYSLLVKDSFIFASNIVGVCCSMYYSIECVSSLSSSLLLAQSTVTQARGQRKSLIHLLLGGMLGVMLGGYVSFIYHSSDLKAGQNVMGYTCILALLAFYTSPLTTLKQVLSSRDASSFSWSLSSTCALNACVWVVYGGMVKQDIFIWGPNLIGLLVSSVQLLCLWMFQQQQQQKSMKTGEFIHPI